jgi:hypothetical protein
MLRQNGSTNIITSNGFESIPNKVNDILRRNRTTNVQIIADASTFGCCIGDIEDLSRVTCFLPECFEEVLLNSEIFSRFYKHNGVNALEKPAIEFPSLEHYYKHEVQKILVDKACNSYIRGGDKAERCILGKCITCMKE